MASYLMVSNLVGEPAAATEVVLPGASPNVEV